MSVDTGNGHHLAYLEIACSQRSVYWQGRADEARAVADSMQNPEHSDAYRAIADDYDMLARLAAEEEKREFRKEKQKHESDTNRPRPVEEGSA